MRLSTILFIYRIVASLKKVSAILTKHTFGGILFTLLHISDLHRSPHDPIENASLIGSLLADRDRYLYESPKADKPNAAIVSGDIIQGVALGANDYFGELRRQYEVAYDFLSKLADRFFDGDHSRIVIVPGNHDICWNTARDAMTELVPEDPVIKASADIFHAASDFRWNWSTRSIFKISDRNTYNQRLDAYWDFVDRFYKGVPLKYPINREQGFNLFELDGGRIVVAALESVHGNDCFCRQAAIERSVLGNCSLAMRDLEQQPILRIAAWHHSFQGPPHGDDYMDIASVHEMIGCGFRLGLHGHQHQADASAYSIHLPEEHSIAISSAGSLCAGSRELPRGTNREYNVIVIDEMYSSARIHVREMTQGNQFGRCGRGIFRIDGFFKLNWQLPVVSAGGASMGTDKFDSGIVLKAEEALRHGRANEALMLLEGIKPPLSGYARKLFIEAAREAAETEKIIAILQPPNSITEFVELFSAFLKKYQHGAAQDLLDKAEQFGIDSGTVSSLCSQLQLQKMIRTN